MRIVAILSLLLASAPCVRAEEPAPAPARYAVEIVIFQNLDQGRTTPETPLPPALAGLPGNSPRDAAEAGPGVEFLLLDPVAEPAAILELPTEDRRLEAAYRRLERLADYRPLAYLAWSQRAAGRDAAQPVWLAEIATLPPGLRGRATLIKERFLHLQLDLYWDGPQPAALTPSSQSIPAAHIAESRRLRGDLVQYFDHPRFGAIAYVRELEPPATAAPDSPSTPEQPDSTG